MRWWGLITFNRQGPWHRPPLRSRSHKGRSQPSPTEIGEAIAPTENKHR
ncbi:hypothetical protein QT970_03750 [Microcoleus sp. herbarium8]